MKPVSVGKDVDSWCTRCKLMLAHTVEAMIAGKITRVHCNTCGAQHAFRPHPPGESAAGARSRRSPKPAASPRTPDYQSLLRGRDQAAAQRYAAGERFAKGDVIRHSSFGLGVVVATKDGNKIEVLFPDGPKVLVHGRAL
ncbi:MAG: hypothetical protein HY699_11055 [Deltaproteobacteria bacterium]|nr:hypothetical protein [Deltaproteobacteria bacterium]